MSKSIVTFLTKKGPKAIGPYSTAKIYNGVMYVSGQIGIVPQTGDLISDKVQEQTERVMQNLKLIIQQTNSSFSRILKCTIYLKDMGDFAKVNQVYGKYFEKDPPARVAIAVASLPKNALVELDAIIAHPEQLVQSKL